MRQWYSFVVGVCLAALAVWPVGPSFGAGTCYVWQGATPAVPYDTWANAATDVQTAVSYASTNLSSYDTVLVTNGNHGITDRVMITNGLTVRSVNGPGSTVVYRSGAASYCVFIVSNASAWVTGLTITNGSSANGAGVVLVAGTVSNCVIQGNTDGSSSGGGAYLTGGLLTHSIIQSNKAGRFGGGVYLNAAGAVLQNSIIRGNAVTQGGQSQQGMGVYNNLGTVQNCLVVGNWTYNSGRDGGAVYQNAGVTRNCTIMGNVVINDTCSGLFRAGGTVSNCIVYFNTNANMTAGKMIDVNTTNGVFFSCSPDLTNGVNGNITADPVLQGDYRLGAFSPCKDTGSNGIWMLTATDLGGTNRIIGGVADMGAYEYFAPAGSLTVDFAGVLNQGFTSLTTVFTALPAGDATSSVYYWWDFGDGNTADGAGRNVVTNFYAAPSNYTVRVTVSNELAQMTNTVYANYVKVYPLTNYVSLTGGNVFPYATWATATTNLLAAVDAAGVVGTTATVVAVTNGAYPVTNTVTMNKRITVHGVNGPTNITVYRSGTAAFQVFTMTHSGALVDGLTITNGLAASGAGLFMTMGTVSNCNIRLNTENNTSGGGAYLNGGLLTHSTIQNNKAPRYGGGVYLNGGGVLQNSIIQGNSVTDGGQGNQGMGVFNSGGTVQNCLVVGNATPNSGKDGAAVYQSSGVIRNCTITGNVVTNCNCSGLYRSGGSVSNCIVYFNTNVNMTAGKKIDIYATNAVVYSCSPDVTNGVNGNITDDPLFQADYRLGAFSPCKNTGTNESWMLTSTDLGGTNRILGGVVDMGAYEYYAVAGALTVDFIAVPSQGFTPLTSVFTATPGGGATNNVYYWWDFGDGNTASGAGRNIVTNRYAAPSNYTVSVTVSNELSQMTNTVYANYVKVYPFTNYVSLTGGHVFPYATWANAATNVQAAVDAAGVAGATGTVVVVTNGAYAVSNTVVLNKAITLRGIDDPTNVTVYRSGASNFRVFSLGNSGALLAGLTITNGLNDSGIGPGAGLYMTAGTVSNCTIQLNTDNYTSGGGAQLDGGLVTHSLIQSNSARRYGGGVRLTGGTLQNSIIRGNTVVEGAQQNLGLGVYNAGGVVQNCLVLGNSTPNANSPWGAGGGVCQVAGVTRNCTIVGNVVINCDCAGLIWQGGAVSNCIVYFNTNASMTAGKKVDLNTTNGVFFSCSPDLTNGANGNITADPVFQANYRLGAFSPCKDTGSNETWMLTATDLGGTNRIVGGVVDIGAYEYYAAAAGLSVDFGGVPLQGFTSQTTVFTAAPAGATNSVYYWWDFGDGNTASGSGRNVVTNFYAVPNQYTVTVTVSNELAQIANTAYTNFVKVYPLTNYVALAGGHVFPYTSWADAATNVLSAVAAAGVVGPQATVVAVTNGAYAVTNSIVLDKGITLHGVNGPMNTTVYRSGSSSFRVVSVTVPGALMDGLTITNGYLNDGTYGPGVNMLAGTVSNCIVRLNTAAGNSTAGGGGMNLLGGLLTHSVVENNLANGMHCVGGGVNMADGVVRACIVRNNRITPSQWFRGPGIFASGGTIENCLVYGNSGTGGNTGVGNSAEGAGICAASFPSPVIVRNCTVAGNTVPAGKVASGIYAGGGAIVQNCIAWTNNGASNAVSSGSTITFSCAPELTSGTGNLTNNPLFRNVGAGDFHPFPSSPCLNAGTNYLGLVSTDLDGSPRLRNKIVDMGCYEVPTLVGSVYTMR